MTQNGNGQVFKGSRDGLALHNEQRLDKEMEGLRREVDTLRAEVKSQADKLAKLRPLGTQGEWPALMADLDQRMRGLERQFDILAARLRFDDL